MFLINFLIKFFQQCFLKFFKIIFKNRFLIKFFKKIFLLMFSLSITN